MFMRTMKNYLKKEDTVKSQDIFIDFSKKGKKKKKRGGGGDSWKIKDELPTFHS